MGAAAGWAVVEADMGKLWHREMACYNNNNNDKRSLFTINLIDYTIYLH